MMKNIITVISLLLIIVACEQPVDNIRGIPTEAAIEAERAKAEKEHRRYQQERFKTFLQEKEDTVILQKQYYLALYKPGEERDQDTISLMELREQHLDHLKELEEEGFASLLGPVSDREEIQGMILFDTPTEQFADSLAKIDPLVKAGRLNVEIYPWWIDNESLE